MELRTQKASICKTRGSIRAGVLEFHQSDVKFRNFIEGRGLLLRLRQVVGVCRRQRQCLCILCETQNNGDANFASPLFLL